jgi:hypothetical protein
MDRICQSLEDKIYMKNSGRKTSMEGTTWKYLIGSNIIKNLKLVVQIEMNLSG